MRERGNSPARRVSIPSPSSPSETALQSLHSAAFSSGAEYVSFTQDVASSAAALEQTLEQVEARMRSVVHARDKRRKVCLLLCIPH